MRPVRTIIAVVFAAAVAVTGCSAHSIADQPSAAPAPPVTVPPHQPTP
jgi:PBP1b-binding outer membrane lipoprotein LpoB